MKAFQTFTKARIDALRPGEAVTEYGLQARCLNSGRVRFTYRRKLPGQPQQEMKIGMHGPITVAQAIKQAQIWAGEIANGKDPAGARKVQVKRAAQSVAAVLDEYMQKRQRADNLRSADQVEGVFERFVKPQIGHMSIYDLKKSDIDAMLDAVENSKNGHKIGDRRSAADHCRRVLNAALDWKAKRDDDFTAPAVAPRINKKDRQRKRWLDDDEIIDLWRALALMEENPKAPKAFPRMVRLLLLAGLRRCEVSDAHADEITKRGWLIPGERMKSGEPHLVPMTDTVAELLGDGDGFLFSSTGGKKPIANHDYNKKFLDATLAAVRQAAGRKPMRPWVLHDLRRTSRSILSRLTTPDTAERVLAHAIPGVRGVYDCYGYADEKRAALEKLAAYIDDLVSPRSGKVVAIRSRQGGVR
jgi:integrase